MAGNLYVRFGYSNQLAPKSEGKIRLGEFLAIIYPDIGFAPKGRNVKNSRLEGVRFFRFHHAHLNFEIRWFARLG
jgi:hypothetical protein